MPIWFSPIDASYFRDYRKKLGFSSQGGAKDFFKANDIKPDLDWKYVEALSTRLHQIVDRLQGVLPLEIREGDLSAFKKAYIDLALSQIRSNELLPKLNNQGRRPEEVYFAWMRGYVTASYFRNALSLLFSVAPETILSVGQDDLSSADTFKRAPTADLQLVRLNGGQQRIEMQSGFSGINDVKEHKVREAKRLFREQGIPTMVIHFDLFNGQVGFIPLEQIEDDSTNWVTRQQMEGQTVFSIDQNSFLWRLTEPPRTIEEYEAILGS